MCDEPCGEKEIFTGEAQLQIVEGNYDRAKIYSENCITLNPTLGDCYWNLALSEIYLKDNIDAQKNIQIADQKGYNTNSEISLDSLVNAYGKVLNYQALAPIFEKLIVINPNNAQYQSYMEFINKKIGK